MVCLNGSIQLGIELPHTKGETFCPLMETVSDITQFSSLSVPVRR